MIVLNLLLMLAFVPGYSPSGATFAESKTQLDRARSLVAQGLVTTVAYLLFDDLAARYRIQPK